MKHWLDRLWYSFNMPMHFGKPVPCPTVQECRHFMQVSLGQCPKKIQREFLTWIEMPPRVQ